MLRRVDESTRVLNIWVDGERIAEDVEIEVGGDIVREGGAGIFNNVWGWRFSGSLDSVALRPMPVRDVVVDQRRLPTVLALQLDSPLPFSGSPRDISLGSGCCADD